MGILPKECYGYKNNVQSGQALLIVLLILSVVLTVAMSVVSRSVTEITITEHEENSARALSAAEAGVEESLMSGISSGGTVSLDNDASYETTVSYLEAADGEFVYPDTLKSGETVTFWLVSHDEDGNLTCASGDCFQGGSLKVCWGDDSAPPSAVELSFYYDGSMGWSAAGDFSGVLVKRLAYDSDSVRIASNNFAAESGACSVSGQGFSYSTPSINLVTMLAGACDPSAVQGCLLMLRVKMLYNQDVPQRIGITSPSGFPAQGAVIDSTGEFNDATRRVQVFRSFPAPPDVFDSTVFSYGGIEK